MTDTERLDFVERTGASIAGITDDKLRPTGFSVCVGSITPWITKTTLRAAIDEVAVVVKRDFPMLLR